MAQILSRAERRKLETRVDILDAALECFAQRGYHATAISHIVEKVGIAQGSFYLHFESKRAIVNEVLNDLLRRVAAALADLPPESPSNFIQYQAQAERISVALGHVISDDARAARFLLLQAAAVDAEMAERVLDFYETLAGVQAAYLQHGVDAGYFRSDIDTMAAARAVNGMIVAAAMHRLRHPSTDATDELSRAIREIIYHGLVRSPQRPI